MLLTNLFFYIYSLLFFFSTIMVIGSNNPIHSVFFLVLSFFNAASLLILLQAEFLAMLFLIIYVGAIAVLFLFVVMMLNIKIVVANFNLLRYLPLAGIISIILFLQLSILFKDIDGIFFLRNFVYSNGYLTFIENSWMDWFNSMNYLIQIEVLGTIIYTYGYDIFLLSGVILLVAMIGAILLTLTEGTAKRQYINQQIEHVSTIRLLK